MSDRIVGTLWRTLAILALGAGVLVVAFGPPYLLDLRDVALVAYMGVLILVCAVALAWGWETGRL